MSDLDEQVTVRMTFVQRSAWERAAAKDKRKLADWIRLRLDDCALREVPPGEEPPRRVPVKRRGRRKGWG